MDALILWRNAAINERASGLPSRPSSPSSDEEDVGKEKEPYDEPLSSDELQDSQKAESDLAEPRSPARKPTSSSWARWWRRGQIKDAEASSGRPKVSKDIANAQVPPVLPSKPHGRDTAPASMPTSPRIEKTTTPTRQLVDHSKKHKKFAKTLRLSSDQLVSFAFPYCAKKVTLYFNFSLEDAQFEAGRKRHHILSLSIWRYCLHCSYFCVGFNRPRCYIRYRWNHYKVCMVQMLILRMLM
jgi:phosphatidate phosphatase LPIN